MLPAPGACGPSVHVVASAWLSALLGVVEFYLAARAASEEHAFTGVAIVSLSEFVGAGAVLAGHKTRLSLKQQGRDGRADAQHGLIIGLALVALGTVWFLDSLIQSLAGSETDTPTSNTVAIALAVLAISVCLLCYKRFAGRQRGGVVVLAHAKCSLCVSVVGGGVLVTMIASQQVQWAGGLFGVATSILVVFQGCVLSIAMRATKEAILLRDEADSTWLLPQTSPGPGHFGQDRVSGFETSNLRLISVDPGDSSSDVEFADEAPPDVTVTI